MRNVDTCRRARSYTRHMSGTPYKREHGSSHTRRDHLSPEARSLAMAKIHRRDTSAELSLRKQLWRAGLRGWRCDFAGLPGRPDLAFTRWQVAVFVDGLLWHGHPRRYPARLSQQWRLKIARNVERDRSVNEALRRLGWVVVRLWDADIHRDPRTSVDAVRSAIAAAQRNLWGIDS
jgi:DNA mismatch endonuclease (patch repair protein)